MISVTGSSLPPRFIIRQHSSVQQTVLYMHTANIYVSSVFYSPQYCSIPTLSFTEKEKCFSEKAISHAAFCLVIVLVILTWYENKLFHEQVQLYKAVRFYWFFLKILRSLHAFAVGTHLQSLNFKNRLGRCKSRTLSWYQRGTHYSEQKHLSLQAEVPIKNKGKTINAEILSSLSYTVDISDQKDRQYLLNSAL